MKGRMEEQKRKEVMLKRKETRGKKERGEKHGLEDER